MRLRIIIDTDDADDPAALENNTPFTLNIYKDDDDGTPSRVALEIGTEGCLIGDDIALMLDELRIAFTRNAVLGQDDEPIPRTGEQWRARAPSGPGDLPMKAVVDTARIALVYRDQQGYRHEQSLPDITTAGVLIDPETGDDMGLVEAVVDQPDGWRNTITRELAGALIDREDDESLRAAHWLAEHEDEVWGLIGGLLDRITKMAGEHDDHG